MPRKKKTQLQLPAKVGEDIKTVSGAVERLVSGAENVIEEVIAWGKKHKLLVLVVVLAVAANRYLFAEDEEEEDY